MIYAEITKCAIVQDSQGRTYLMAVVEYDKEMLNIKVEYDFDTLNFKEFFEAIEDEIAETFGIETKRVEINEGKLLERMRKYSLWQNGVFV